MIFFPPNFDNIPILAVKFAHANVHQRDEIKLELHQPSKLFLCLDNRIKMKKNFCLPSWITKDDYLETEMILKTSLDSLTFCVYSATKPAGIISLGGLGGSGLTFNYLLLIVSLKDLKVQGTKSTSESRFSRKVSSLFAHKTSLDRNMSGNGTGNHTASNMMTNIWGDPSTQLIIQEPPLNALNRKWSTPFNVTASNKSIVCSTGCLLSVISERFVGIHHRTVAVTIVPRYIVVNHTEFDFEVWPHSSSQERMLSSIRKYSYVTNTPKFVPLQSKDTCLLYYFWHESTYSQTKNNRNYISLHHLRVEDTSNDEDSIIWTDVTYDYEYYTKEVCIDNVGEKFVWFRNFDDSKKYNTSNESLHILSIATSYANGSLVIHISNVTSKAPYRIENRALDVTLRFRQYGCSMLTATGKKAKTEEESWADVPPHSWRSFVWLNHDVKPCFLEVAVKGEEMNSKCYAIDDLTHAKLASLMWRETLWRESNTSSSRGYDDGGGILGGYVYISGSTRIVVFYEDVGYQSVFQNDMYATSSGRRPSFESDFNDVEYLNKIPNHSKSDEIPEQIDRLLSSIQLNIKIESSCITLIDSNESKDVALNTSTTRHSTRKLLWEEVLSISSEIIDVSIDFSDLKCYLSIFHIQVDDMRSAARFPVIFVGTDSGLNSHLRSPSHVRFGVGDTIVPSMYPAPIFEVLCTGSKQCGNPLTLKTLSVIFSNMTCKIDIDLIMRVIGILGKLTPPPDDNVVEHQLIVSQLLNLQLSTIVKNASESMSANSRFIELIKISPITIQLEVYL